MRIQAASLNTGHSAGTKTATVAEHSEMPYHYEFKEDSDEVNVSLHDEMDNINKTTQASLLELYAGNPDDQEEFYGIDEVKLQEQQETAHLKKQKNS